MVDWGIIIGALSLIPVGFYVYDRFSKTNKEPVISIEETGQPRLHPSRSVSTYDLLVKNSGGVVAQGVEVRLSRVEQASGTTAIQDRYILHRSDFLPSGDSHRFTFISDYGDKLLTPAGTDKHFPREDGVFTFLVSGHNFKLVTVKLRMSWEEEQNRYVFKKLG